MQINQENIVNIVNKYSDMVYRLALTRCTNYDMAEDVFQDVFLKISEKQPKFKDQEHEKAWIIRVTINMTKNMNKSAWNRKIVELDENIASDNNYADENNVFDEVMRLPQDYRTVIYLFYYEGYKVNEISKMLETSEGTIKTWL